MFNHDVWDMMYWIALLAACRWNRTKFKDTNVAHGQQDFSTNLIQGPHTCRVILNSLSLLGILTECDRGCSPNRMEKL